MDLARQSQIRIWLVCMLVAMVSSIGVSAQERMVSMGDSIDPVPFSRFLATGLYVMDIETVDHEWPTCDYIKSPSNGWGKSITNATKVPGRLKIYEGDRVVYDSGDYIKDAKGMTIRIRGNSSAYNYAKPYKIDLQDKADLLMRNNPSYRDKDWALIRDLRQLEMQGCEVNRLLGLQWTPGYGYVNLILNNEYLGLYMLIETVKRNTNCRLNVSKTGFIFEHDAYWWKLDYSIPSILYPMMRYTFKYPDTEELTAANKAYMKQRISDYEQSVRNGTYPEQIDVTSIAKWQLGHDILGVNDGAGSNRFFTIYDLQSKIVAGNMWDFDSSEITVDNWSRSHLVLLKDYFKSANRDFVNEYVSEWYRIRETLVPAMQDFYAKYKASAKGQALQRSCELENIRWSHSYVFYYNIMSRVDWLKARKKWLDRQMNILNPVGDANVDGKVDVEDVNAIINTILGIAEGYRRPSDVNQDGKIDVEDVNAVINIILNV
ncbi:MAG: CotH kinase family protein [Muribaculaceae bacterium]|nr:CotH kinase family protein [Muribaculaceae bacterium]